MEYAKTGISAPPSPFDIEVAKASKQWFHQGSAFALTFAEAQKNHANQVFYLTKATGSNLTLAINDKDGNAKVVSAAASELDFLAAPFCLGRFGFAIGGTVNMITGFYV